MPVPPVPLARVMTQANEQYLNADQVRRGPGLSAQNLGEPAGAPAPRRTHGARAARGARAVRHSAGGPAYARASRRDDPRRAGRPREGAAAVHDPGHRRARAAQPGDALGARDGQAPGDALGDRRGPGPGVPVAQAEGRLAGPAPAGADPAGAGEAARGGSDSGKTQPVVAGGNGRVFSSLHTRNYRLFATGQVISNTGTWMQRVAQDWLVLELTHGSGSALGITTGLQFLPLLLFSLWGGMIADRYSKRLVLMGTQAAMGALALILGVLALTHSVAIWQVYALAFAGGMVTVVDNPTRQAFATEMVGRSGLANAIALNSAVFNLARIAGPAVAGLVIAALGTPAAFLVNAASYGAVLISLKRMRVCELNVVESVPRAKGQLREAMQYVKERPALWMTMVLIFFVATFGMNFQVTNALMSRVVFHAGAGLFGLASAVFAVGALGGALLAARRARPTMALLLATAFAFSVLEVISGFMPGYWSYLIMLVPTGLALLTFTTAANSVVQLGTTADMRGRVMGLYLLVLLGGAPLGSPLVGWAAQAFGPRVSLLAGGAISLVATTAIGLMLARSRGKRVREYLRPARLVA